MDELLRTIEEPGTDVLGLLDDPDFMDRFAALPAGSRARIRERIMQQRVRGADVDRALRDADRRAQEVSKPVSPYEVDDASPLAPMYALTADRMATIFEPANLTLLATMWVDDEVEVRKLFDVWRANGMGNVQEVERRVRAEAKILVDAR